MSTPCVSVIVPVYRVERYLPDCIHSIRMQTFHDFELILMDDGSPDSCPALCDEAAQQDARIRVIHQANTGLSAARNAGIDAARGTWIALVRWWTATISFIQACWKHCFGAFRKIRCS